MFFARFFGAFRFLGFFRLRHHDNRLGCLRVRRRRHGQRLRHGLRDKRLNLVWRDRRAQDLEPFRLGFIPFLTVNLFLYLYILNEIIKTDDYCIMLDFDEKLFLAIDDYGNSLNLHETIEEAIAECLTYSEGEGR